MLTKRINRRENSNIDLNCLIHVLWASVKSGPGFFASVYSRLLNHLLQRRQPVFGFIILPGDPGFKFFKRPAVSNGIFGHVDPFFKILGLSRDIEQRCCIQADNIAVLDLFPYSHAGG